MGKRGLSKFLTSWYRRWVISQYQRVNPLGQLMASENVGSYGVPHPFDMLHDQMAYLVNVYAYAAIKAKARDVSSCPIVLERERKGGQWEIVTSHPVAELLKRPNPNESLQQLVNMTVLRLDAAGNAYNIYDQLDNELYTVQSHWITVKVGPDGRVSGYAVTHKGLHVDEDRDTIVHYRHSHPLNDVYGLCPTEVIKNAILTDLYSDQFIKNFFKKGAHLGVVLSTDQMVDPDKAKALVKEFNAMYGGADEAFKSAMLPFGVKAEVLRLSLQDTVPAILDAIIQRKVLAAYGVPPMVIGDQEQKYANAVEQMKQYQGGTCEESRVTWETGFNHQFLMVRYPKERLRARFDRKQIQVLSEDKDKTSVRATREYRSGLITLNEARADIGKEPVDQALGGDEFFMGTMIDPLTDPEINPATEPARMATKKRLRDMSRTEMWRAHDARLVRHEASIRKAMAAVFREQRDRCIDKVQSLTARGSMMTALWLRMDWNRAEDDDVDPSALSDIFDVSAEIGLTKDAIKPVAENIAQRAGDVALSQAELGLAFDVRNPYVQSLINSHVSKLADNVTRNTYKLIKSAIRDAYDAGETIGQLTARLEDLFDDFSRVRAQTIARTETNGIVNGATNEAYDQGGIEKKEWLAVQDGVTRDAHLEADGQVVLVTQPFTVMGELLQYPGDTSGSAENIINCRCTMIPVV